LKNWQNILEKRILCQNIRVGVQRGSSEGVGELNPVRTDRNQASVLSRAKIADNGATNEDAMKAALSKLLLHVLYDEVAEPVLFLPLLSKGNLTVPVKLTSVTIANNTLSLTVIPLDAQERATLLDQIKQPTQVVVRSN
jgi:hypothetical protein